MNDLGKVVKAAVMKQNMLAWQFGTIGVSDAITMGGEGMTPTLTLSKKAPNPNSSQECASPSKPVKSSPTPSKP